MKNNYEIVNGVVEVECIYADEAYKVLINVEHMSRMIEELKSINLRMTSKGEVHAWAIFKDRHLVTPYKFKKDYGINLVRFILKTPKKDSRKKARTIYAEDGIIDLTDESTLAFRSATLWNKKKANNPAGIIHVGDKYGVTLKLVRGKNIDLGLFDTREEAIAAKIRAEKRVHGFSKLEEKVKRGEF